MLKLVRKKSSNTEEVEKRLTAVEDQAAAELDRHATAEEYIVGFEERVRQVQKQEKMYADRLVFDYLNLALQIEE